MAVNEAILGVNIALGRRAPSDCPSIDADRSGGVQINELIRVVNYILNGCP